MLFFPPFRLDLADERLWKDGALLKLRSKPFAILRYLALHPQRLVTQDELIEAVWGKVVLSESLLRTHVREVRQVLGDGVIETVVGRGYRFVCAVHEVETQEPDSSPPLVGRTIESRTLLDHLDKALGRRRQMIMVTGGPGIGKTALVEALLERAAVRGALVARGTCVEQYGRGEAYLPALDALGAACRGAHGKLVLEILGRYAPSWLTQLPGLVTGDNLAALQQRVQGTTQARMLRELADALEALSVDVPVVLALDDLQWVDNSTTELLSLLARRRAPARILVVGTYRKAELARSGALSKEVGELEAHGLATALPLEALGAAAVGEYIGARWPGHDFPEQLTRTVHQATSGNPLFMVALLDDLESRQLVRRDGGAWRLVASVEELGARVPETVRQLIDIQIERLSASEQRILEAAAVAGAEFTAGAVAHALELPVEDVDASCEALTAQGRFLRGEGAERWPDGTVQSRYAFVHALYQHAAAARSSSAVTRLWHRRIAERLEVGYGNGADGIAAKLAAHFDAGQSLERAVHYYELAGLRAAHRSGGVEARAHFGRALELLLLLPETRERDRLELTLLRRLGSATIAANGLESADLLPTFTRAAELARRFGDDASLGAALVGLQQCRMLRGALREIGAHAAEVEEVARRTSAPATASWGRLMNACASLHRGHLAEGRRTLAECVDTFDRSSAPSNSEGPSFPQGPLLFSNFALAEWLSGRPDSALASALTSVSLAESVEDPFTLALGLAAVANVHLWRRDAPAALEFARRGMQVATDAGAALALSRTVPVFHLASVLVGRSTAAAALKEIEAAHASLFSPSRSGWTNYRLNAIEVAARAGQVELALTELSALIAFAEEHDERAWEPELHRLRGELWKTSDETAAERSFAIALELAQAQRSRSFELRAAMSLFRLTKKRTSLESLRRAYASFAEGSTTGDLIEAKQLLERA